MKQRYHHYELWEDWRAGMYRHAAHDASKILNAGKLLASAPRFALAAELMVEEWVYATEHNLTDLSQNRSAWLGQAACSHDMGATREETCIAWNGYLTDRERSDANKVADGVIGSWVSNIYQQAFAYA